MSRSTSGHASTRASAAARAVSPVKGGGKGVAGRPLDDLVDPHQRALPARALGHVQQAETVQRAQGAHGVLGGDGAATLGRRVARRRAVRG